LKREKNKKSLIMGDALWNENKTGPDSSWKNEIYKCDVANKGRLLRCCATVETLQLTGQVH
jgi:hypothetical protein